jgi:capsular polysaccharide biosynthesis protein
MPSIPSAYRFSERFRPRLDNVELRDYGRVLGQRWWLVVFTGLVAMATALAYARAQPASYRTSIRLEATGRIDYGQVLAVDKLLRQLAARARTSAVATEVENRLHTDLAPDALLGRVKTLAISDVLHIQIDVEDGDATRAERIAQAWGQVVEEQQLAAMSNVPGPERVLLQVVDRPGPAQSTVVGTRSLVMAAGLLGLLGGVLIVFGLNYLDDTLKTELEVTRHLALPTLGLIPSVSGRRGRRRSMGRITESREAPA